MTDEEGSSDEREIQISEHYSRRNLNIRNHTCSKASLPIQHRDEVWWMTYIIVVACTLILSVTLMYCLSAVTSRGDVVLVQSSVECWQLLTDDAPLAEACSPQRRTFCLSAFYASLTLTFD